MTHSSRVRGGRARTAVLVAVAIVVLAAGCSSGDDADGGALPIEPILIGEIEVRADAAGTSATVEVSTSIPLACAVVYGIDETFGSVAVDDDMAGGAHEAHTPLLRGLVPDTEYSYVLQGSDATGAFYRSDVMTFRTPVASAPAGIDNNVATSGAVVGASSSFSDQFDATFAIDGDVGTEWSSAGDGDDAWIEIELDDVADVVGFGLRSRSMSDGTAVILTYRVVVDGDAVLGPFSADDEFSPVEPHVFGQSFRFEAESTTGGNTGAAEVLIHVAE